MEKREHGMSLLVKLLFDAPNSSDMFVLAHVNTEINFIT